MSLYCFAFAEEGALPKCGSWWPSPPDCVRVENDGGQATIRLMGNETVDGVTFLLFHTMLSEHYTMAVIRAMAKEVGVPAPVISSHVFAVERVGGQPISVL